MIRFATIMIMLLLGYNLVFAQQSTPGVTTVIRDWDSSENIDHLNENFNIDDVSMDEVIYIKENDNPNQGMTTSTVSSSSTSMGGAMTSGVPLAAEVNAPVQVANPAPAPIQVNNSTPNPATTSTSNNSSSTKSYPKTSSKKKKSKVKRSKLKKKKFKKYKGKSCFRF